MLNVIEFRKRAPRSRDSGVPLSLENAAADVSELAFRVTGLQSKAKREIADAILMLDLAAQQARRIAERVRDPATRKDFDEHISMIEQLLQVARKMALKL